MQILEHQNQRARTAVVDKKLTQELEGLRLDCLRAREGRCIAARFDTKKMQQKRHVAVGFHPNLAQGRTQLFVNDLGRVGIADTAKTAQQVENQQVGNRRAVGEAPPLDPNHRLAEPTAEFGKEPRFANAGLADNTERLAATLRDRMHQVVQHGHLAGAIDERP